ncbi:MAG: NUDIX domain-containing protein [Caldilineaceae bacterium]
MEITRHSTATVLIVNHDKILLHYHKKFNRLLPVGGHVDPDELPEEAAIREVKEETGLSVKLYNPDPTRFPDVRALVQPVHMLLFNSNGHQHIDFIFYAKAETDAVNPATGESTHLHWYRREEILKENMPENVRILALEALDLLAKEASW